MLILNMIQIIFGSIFLPEDTTLSFAILFCFFLLIFLPISLIIITLMVRIIILDLGWNKFKVNIDEKELINIIKEEGFIEKNGIFYKKSFITEYTIIKFIYYENGRVMKICRSLTPGGIPIKIYSLKYEPEYAKKTFKETEKLFALFPEKALSEIE
ncbi:MAG: hypothetical protein MUC62_08215 [Candidatus Thermoplasmatota archaeon]|nr:hypothetical protein [Candidatus Thermoplasmatota archaeon]